MILVVALSVALACIPHRNALDVLWDNWKEVVVSSGITSEGALLETTANRETGTWTLLLTKPGKLTCSIGQGWGWKGGSGRKTQGEEDA